MDDVGCYGTEDRLIDCAYHTDTSEDSHSGDVWMDCSNSQHRDRSVGPKVEKTTSTIVALVALIGFILLLIAFAAYILCTKRFFKKVR